MAVVVYPLVFGVWELCQSHGPFHMRSASHHFANPLPTALPTLPSTNSTDLATCPISGDVMCMVTRDLVSQPIILQWHMIQGSVICDLSLLITSTTLLRKTKDHQACPMFPLNFLKLAKEKKESSGGVVVRALASHQWPRFDLHTRCHMWVEFVGSLLCYEKFCPEYSGFPISSKTCICIKFDLY